MKSVNDFLEKNKIFILIAIILISFIFRVTLSQLVPLGSGPDEAGHFNYIRYFEANWTIPVLNPSDVRGTVWYTIMQQPPLYHGINAVVYSLVKEIPLIDVIHAMRPINAIIAIITILFIFLITRELTKNNLIIFGTTSIIAFLPTHIIITSVLNNGPLMWMFVLASFYFMILSKKRKFSTKFAVFAGIFFGAAVVAKFTATTMGIAYLFFAYLFFKNSKSTLLTKLVVLIIPFLIFSPLYMKNILLYDSLIAYVPPYNLGYTGLEGLELVKTYMLHIFAGIWLQEYGTSTIPDYRISYFLFLGVMAIISAVGLISIFVKNLKAINLTSITNKFNIPALLLLFVIFDIGVFAYMLNFWFFPDARFIFQSIIFVMLFFVIGLHEFWKRLMAEALFTISIFAIIISLLIMDFTVILNYNTELPFVPWPILEEFS